MTTYKQGDWNAICAVCGFEYKASEMKWNNQLQDWTCKWDWEPRHPQERLRAVHDDQSVPWTRSEPSDTFINAMYVELSTTDPIFPAYVNYGYYAP